MLEQISLNALRDGQSACVTGVDADPAMRRRLLDIGLIPGTRVTCQGHSPAGDPAAYVIRGAVIALRSQDAAGITLEREPVREPLRRAVLA